MCIEKYGLKRLGCLYVDGKHAVEIQGASLMLLIGVWLWFNNTFEVSAVYTIMSSIGTERQWSIVFAVIATTQLLSIFFENFRWRWRFIAINATWIRKHILLLKGAVWLTLFMGVVSGDARALSAPMFFVFAVNAFRAFFCITKEEVDT